MIYFSRFHYRSFVTLFLFLAAIGLTVNFVWLPLWAKNSELMDRLQVIPLEQEILKQQNKRLENLRHQADTIRQEENRLRVVVEREQLVTLIKEIEALSRDTRNTIRIESGQSVTQSQAQTKRVQKPKKTDGESAEKNTNAPDDKPEETLAGTLPSEHHVEVTLNLTGDYTTLYRFLKRLEALHYFVDVISMEIGPFQVPVEKAQARTDLFSPQASSSPGEPPALTAPSSSPPLFMTLQTIIYVLD